MEVITYSEWINQGNRQIAQEIALLTAQAGVDEIVDMDTYTNFPTEGADGLLYLAKDTGKLYTWNSTSKSYVRVDAGSDYVLPQATAEVLGGVMFGTASGTACEGNDARLSDDRTPKSHTHGNITNDGKIGEIAGVVMTSSDGSVNVVASGAEGEFLAHNGSWATPPDYVLPQATAGVLGGVKFGTASGTACEGNDSRLTNSRTPLSHTHGKITNTGKIGENAGAGVVITDLDGSVNVVASGAEGEFLAHNGSWATPPDTVSNISLNTSTILTEAPEVSDGNGVIWYDNSEEEEGESNKGFNITIKLEGYKPETIKLSTGALTALGE